MIVTDQFVYIHTSRHAGTFTNKLILEHVSGAKMLRYHGHLSDLPKEYADLPVIGFVRNPWDWYVSMYFNYKRKRQYLFDIISEGCTLEFKETLIRYLTLGDKTAGSGKLRKRLEKAAPSEITSATPAKFSRPGLVSSDFNGYSAGLGYYSWLFMQMHERKGRIRGSIGRFEDLRAELLRLMEKTGTPITPAMRAYIVESEKLNSSSRDTDYRGYYDEELQQLVYEKDKRLIEKFGYQF